MSEIDKEAARQLFHRHIPLGEDRYDAAERLFARARAEGHAAGRAEAEKDGRNGEVEKRVHAQLRAEGYALGRKEALEEVSGKWQAVILELQKG